VLSLVQRLQLEMVQPSSAREFFTEKEEEEEAQREEESYT